ncbi:MAG TPA: hypothetical protein VHU13_01000 [Solirubrobacteraceae bacterium]|jgi:hypothetical protein|nr:hypothetical protein [Solirubrobacteraceae bacterium]
MSGRARIHTAGLGAVTIAATALCALALVACGDTLQDQPIGSSQLESVIVSSRFPVYWLGRRFDGLRITSVLTDPGGAVTLRYGDCLVGGQFTCVAPISLITSPNNGFLPGAQEVGRAALVRGAHSLSTQGGRTLAIRTGSVVVTVRADSPVRAYRAALAMTPVNKVGLPYQSLPPAVPDTGFGRLPLPSQLPPGSPVPQFHG